MWKPAERLRDFFLYILMTSNCKQAQHSLMRMAVFVLSYLSLEKTSFFIRFLSVYERTCFVECYINYLLVLMVIYYNTFAWHFCWHMLLLSTQCERPVSSHTYTCVPVSQLWCFMVLRMITLAVSVYSIRIVWVSSLKEELQYGVKN